ncbi:hypothetical protein ABZ897_55680 [Nonomuraea sp. NPDC046802]|uniref:hypothetical protein n=1 Tax=Nonomuraea sp. NPDC046802 TaxID=3154919 RepID=UPI0033F3A9B0
MDLTTLHAVVRRFPLVGRARPACPSLPERVKEIADIADTAARQGADALHEGAHALNKAALLASDCGLPDLARDLCWQHINIYREAGHHLTGSRQGTCSNPRSTSPGSRSALTPDSRRYDCWMRCTERFGTALIW